MTAFLAMMVDAYRELNARKLFWVTMAISGVVVLGFGSIGFTDKGVSILFGLWNPESPMTAGSPMARAFYMGLFSYFIVGLWMTWAATILALISTTSIFPDFMAGGAIDIVLSKPVGRLRLFLMKYVASLLFVILQVAVFCGGIFLCVGLRIGEWNPKIFLGIPIITVFFSYLFAVNVLVGVTTRSALTALLMTIIFWFSIFGFSLADTLVYTIQTEQKLIAERTDEEIATVTDRLERLSDADTEAVQARRAAWESNVENLTSRRDGAQKLADALDPWHRGLSAVMYVLPKTDETVNLLSRALKDPSGMDIMSILEGDFDDGPQGEERQSADRIVREEVDQRSLLYVLGTSLAFEFLVLAFAARIFCRRDF